jgi:hypothetical protein
MSVREQFPLQGGSSSNLQTMVDMPIKATPIDRNVARELLQRLQQIPKHRDIRRHHVRCLGHNNTLIIGVQTKAPPKCIAVFGQGNSDYGTWFRVTLMAKNNRIFHAFYDGSLRPGFRVFTVPTASMEQLAAGYEIKPANRAPYDAEVTGLNDYATRIAQEEKSHVFDFSELREICALSENDVVNLTAHDHLQAGFAISSAKHFGRLIYSIKGGDGPITEQHREIIRNLSPAVADLLTRHDFVKGFLDLQATEIACFASAYSRDQLTFPEEIETLLSLFYLCLLRHPKLTAMGLRLPYLVGHNMRTIEIAADQLGEDSKTSIELAKSYWSVVSLLPFEQDMESPSILSPYDIYLSTEELSKQIEPFKDELKGTEKEWQSVTQELMEECQSLKQWSIPWGAHVEINYLGFSAVNLYEEGKYVNCLGGRQAAKHHGQWPASTATRRASHMDGRFRSASKRTGTCSLRH